MVRTEFNRQRSGGEMGTSLGAATLGRGAAGRSSSAGRRPAAKSFEMTFATWSTVGRSEAGSEQCWWAVLLTGIGQCEPGALGQHSCDGCEAGMFKHARQPPPDNATRSARMSPLLIIERCTNAFSNHKQFSGHPCAA